MPQMTLQQAFELAVQQHQTGRLQEAEGILRQILSAQPNHADALHFLALVVYQTGRTEMGIDLLQRAISINPQSAYFCNLGRMLAESGRFDDAFKCYNEAIRLRPDNFEAFHNLTTGLLASNQIDAAIEAAQRALMLRPNAFEMLNSLGQALHKKGRVSEAVATLRRAIELNPKYASAHNNLGITLESLGDIAGATAEYSEAIRLDPNNAIFWINFGKNMQAAREPDAAIHAFNQAIRLAPQNQEGYFNLGNALHDKSFYEEAAGAFRKALVLQPGNAGILNNLALSLHAKGDYVNEIQTYQSAALLDPDLPLVQYNLGLARLLMGDFENGWKGYEYRTRTKELEIGWLQFDQPRWDGQDLGGRRILVHAEQALGDTIQFVRYLSEVKQRQGKVIFQVQPELYQLLKNDPNAEQVIARGDSLPEFDVQCPLLSLPLILRNDWKIPDQVPYITAEVQKVAHWRAKLVDQTRLKVGLFWHGRQKPDPRRSIRLAQLAPIAEVKDISFISLQVGDGSDQARTPPSGMELSDWTSEITDLSDTAALIENLDLVISIDTSVAHLAGAMGKPLWVLLPFVADWRWHLDRSDSPWYPTARLFRQPKIGDWESVVSEVAAALKQLRIG